MFLIQEPLLMLKVMEISYTRKMCPHEKSSGDWVTSKRFSLPEVKLPQVNQPGIAAGSVL